MDTERQTSELAMRLAELLARNTAASINTKLESYKQSKEHEKTIRYLEETINVLLADKNEGIRIAKAYEHELVSQQISEEDIEYITHTIVPLLEKLIENNSEGAEREKLQSYVAIIKAVLSKETITVMQLVGFNFKKAVGEPLTILLQRLILSKSPQNDAELQKLRVENSNLTLKTSLDPEAAGRFLKLTGQ